MVVVPSSLQYSACRAEISQLSIKQFHCTSSSFRITWAPDPS